MEKQILTEQEIMKIFSWQPYREDWPADRNRSDDNIVGYYGEIIKSLTQNELFDTYYSEDGGLGNYLEFFCYPAGQNVYEGNSILVCVSLCAPIAAYGQTAFLKTNNSIRWGPLFAPEMTGVINDTKLLAIAKEIKSIFNCHNIDLVDKEFASRLLPIEVAKNLEGENHNEGNQYLHGLFQKTD
jgi:hypothetical protein